MTRILWDAIGSRYFSAGVDRGVLYLQNGSGVAWNGLTAVNEAPSGADVVEGYYDGVKFFSKRKVEAYEATIEAFTYPLEFEEYDGRGQYVTGQARKPFGFSYRTRLGNDVDGVDHGYLIHIIYNARVAPSTRAHRSLSSSVELTQFSWPITTTPIPMAGRIGSHLIIDTRIANDEQVANLEAILYGSAGADPMLPTAEFIIDLFEDASILKIIDHGDGTWTAEGPDEAIEMLTADLFEITWPSAVYIDAVTYQISSL